MTAQVLTHTSRDRIGDKDYPTRYVSVVFGNPRSEECAGFGLCRLDEDWDTPGQPPFPRPKPPKDVSGCLSGCCRGIAAVERAETKEGKLNLLVRFLKSDLTPATIKKHFSATHFTVDSSISLPITLTAAFDMDPSVCAAGLYEMVETNAYFQIQIQIT